MSRCSPRPALAATTAGFPKLGLFRPNPSAQGVTAPARYDYIVAPNGSSNAAYKASNPGVLMFKEVYEGNAVGVALFKPYSRDHMAQRTRRRLSRRAGC